MLIIPQHKCTVSHEVNLRTDADLTVSVFGVSGGIRGRATRVTILDVPIVVSKFNSTLSDQHRRDAHFVREPLLYTIIEDRKY